MPSGVQGRIACENCNGRGTEIIRSSRSTNRVKVNCHDCNHEWTEYTGPECPECGSRHTKRGTFGVMPHRWHGIKCFDCGEKSST